MTLHRDDLPAFNFAGRVDAVRKELDGRTMLLSHLTNIRWLTGFGGSAASIVVGPDRFVFLTDGRYRDIAAECLATAGVDAELGTRRTREELAEAVVAAASAHGDPVLAEAEHVSHAAWTKFADQLVLEPAGGIVERLRRVKDDAELARIRLAAEIADATLVDVAPLLAALPTEADVRDELEYRMRRAGADAPSYDTIVASGPVNAARPHHRSSRRTIVEGDLVIIDVGALVDGYHSDMTRTFVVGEPNAEQHRVHDLVREAQVAGLEAVAPGVSGVDLDETCRAVFRAAGLEDEFIHGTGHGVGLDIHEQPFAARTSNDTLVAGDVVTVEPGLYRDGLGGVRIEDLLVVTPDGGEPLTSLSKDCLLAPGIG